MSVAASGFVKVTMYLRPDQYRRLRVMALAKSESDGGRPDYSALIRGMVDLTLDRAPEKKAANARKDR